MKLEERRGRCQEEQNEGRRRVRKNGCTVENVLAQMIANNGWVVWSGARNLLVVRAVSMDCMWLFT